MHAWLPTCFEVFKSEFNYSYFNGPEQSNEIRQKENAKFIQDYVLNYLDLDPHEIWRQLLKKQTVDIIVSNVVDPCLMQIQLAENRNALEILMADLEKVYCGIGASYYNMPPEYMTHGRLCAALFPLDNNWHRCKIVGVERDLKKVRVNYLDYGGEGIIPYDNVKFLDKQFAALPIQSVNAKLFNIKSRRI